MIRRFLCRWGYHKFKDDGIRNGLDHLHCTACKRAWAVQAYKQKVWEIIE